MKAAPFQADSAWLMDILTRSVGAAKAEAVITACLTELGLMALPDDPLHLLLLIRHLSRRRDRIGAVAHTMTLKLAAAMNGQPITRVVFGGPH